MRKKTIVIVGAAAAVLVVGLGGTGIAYAVTDGFEQSDALTGSDLDRASSAALDEIGGGTVTSAERDDSFYELDLLGSDGVGYDVVLDEGFGVVSVERDGARDASDDSGSDDSSAETGTGTGTGAARDSDDLVGEELQKASDAAIAAAGGGTVTDAEKSDDADHAFEVEVRLADGTEVDVELDSSYTVTRTDR
ncbi:PepSY domain-containing protein [Herbiconiux sp.]|uniref:PepSY domain-containing protein n=1 Tax=Herbiconiux sp. TaxID=1871186 RepID=UPI0025C45F95|nr:PepSY domain-containing protein [Herbiconiux sp.]